MRRDSRRNKDIRPVDIKRHYLPNTYSSCLISFGKTIVLCSAKAQNKVPDFLSGTGKGWITAEYSMLPSSTIDRKQRDRAGKADSRSIEIQRLIGRSIRAICDLKLLGERTVWIDCDVLNADGGTRTASITGAFIAFVDCIQDLKNNGAQFPVEPVTGYAAAVSAGIVNGEMMLDLAYDEDSRAHIDMNVCASDNHGIIEVQATSEDKPVQKEQFNGLLELCLEGIDKLIAIQKANLEDIEFLPG